MHLVKAPPPPDTPGSRSRARRADMPVLQCPRCRSIEVIETRIGVGKGARGTKQLLCAACLMRGERVVIR